VLCFRTSFPPSSKLYETPWALWGSSVLNLLAVCRRSFGSTGNPLLWLTALAAFATLLNLTAAAQVSDPILAAQAPISGVGHTYIGKGAEIVNPVDGSLTFNLPIKLPAGRGLSLPVGIRYSTSELSSIFCNSVCSSTVPSAINDFNGWSYDLPVYVASAWVTGSAPNPQPCSPYPSCQTMAYCWGAGNYVFSDASEGLHPLQIYNVWPDPNNLGNIGCPTSGISTGGGGNGLIASMGTQGSRIQPPLTVTNRAGTVYQFSQGPSLNFGPPGPGGWSMLAQSVTDRNGNQVTLNGQNVSYGGSPWLPQLPPGSYKDTLGRTVLSWSGMGSNTGDTLTASGLSGNVLVRWVSNPISYQGNRHFMNGSANDPTYCGSGGVSSGPLPTVSEIDFPNGQKYTFTYGGTGGRLSQITFPDGGYVRYIWGVNASSVAGENTWYDFYNNPQYCYFTSDTFAITDRYVSYDGVNEVLHQHFTYASPAWSTLGSGEPYWPQKTTTMTTTDSLTGQSTTTTQTYAYTWEGVITPPNSSMSAVGPVLPKLGRQIPLESQIVDSDAGGIRRTINQTWFDPYSVIGNQTILDNGQGMTTLRCPDGGEEILDTYQYDFQSAGAKPVDPACAALTQPGTTLSTGLNTAAIGPLKRHTTAIYHNFANNILDKPDSVTVSDGSGNKVSQTTYTYDTNAVLASGATTGLVSPPGARGNLSSISRWLSGGTAPTTTYLYFDTGQVKSMTDACGNTACSDIVGTNHTTTFSYADSFASGTGTPPGQTNAYLTQVTFPNTGVARIENFTWGYADGLIRSRIDLNGRTTSYLYNDPLLRLTSETDPDGGQTTFSYNDITPSPSVTRTKAITSSLNLASTTTSDGMGHAVTSVLSSDPEGADTTGTVYDGFGRVWTQTNLHRSAPAPTDGTTKHTYDALGRGTSILQPDGSTLTTSYTGNCSIVTDEGGASRRSCSDALGRLIQIDEPGSGTPGTPGSAIVTITGKDRHILTGSSVSGGSVASDVIPNSCQPNCPITIYDSGTVTITINGYLAFAAYDQSSTPASIASALTAILNNISSPVAATVSGGSITMTSHNGGSASNYPLATTSATDDPTDFGIGTASFPFNPTPPSVLTGGTNTGPPPPPSLSTPATTLYTYDPLDNLVCVEQHGGVTATGCSSPPSSDSTSSWRVRRFSYDSLSRLTGATNPESGLISYTYDANSNVATKIAPKPNQTGTATVTTTYSYDATNRLTKKTYSDTTPTIQYGYDGVALTGCTTTPPTLTDTNPKGRRTSMCDASGGTTWASDITAGVGWKSTQAQTINGVTKTTISQSNLGGMLAQLTYPSGRAVTYTPSAAARALSAADTANSINYAGNAKYAPFGGITSLTNGSAPITTTNSYNERLQPTLLSAATTANTILSFSYDFHRANGDNGNVFQVVNNLDNTRTKNYTYDPLNRIASAYTQGNAPSTRSWGETFTIDAWGNVNNRAAITGKTNYEPLSAAALVSNRLTGYGYDTAGNMTSNGSATYTYDAENRLTATAGVTYTYDGDGTRVKKSNGTLYWGSGPLAESDLTATATSWKEYVLFNGKRVARRDASNSSVHYYFADHLGSTSIISNSTGTTLEEDLDYYPYGGVAGGTASDHYLFTGKERDSESGLDYFEARHYGSALGRFIQPDEPFADQDTLDPQSWNLYSYVRNNPMNSTDPHGRSHCVQTDRQGTLHCYTDEQWKRMQAEGARKADANLLWSWGQLLSYLTPAGWLYHGLGGRPLTEQPSNAGEASGMRMENASLGLAGFGAGFSVSEQAIADLLEAEGSVVVPLEVVQGQKNADALVNGVTTEFKTVTAAGPNTLKNQIQDGLKQGQNVVIDARATSITKAEAMQQIKRAEGNVGSVQGRVTIYTKEGKVSH
jgi:RHS repeat-associated protein